MAEKYTAEMAHAAVARGAAWLDSKCPDWVGKIDLEALDLGSPELCMLGQTAACLGARAEPADAQPDYWDVLGMLGLEVFAPWQADHGFDVPNCLSEHSTLAYEMLTIAWKELIRERLAVPA